MGTGIDKEKQRARWRRNKRDERARKPKPIPAELSPEFVARVMAERDRRVAAFATPGMRSEYPYQLWAELKGYRVPGTWEKVDAKSQAFLGDVWAARTLLAHQRGKAGATAIAKWLTENGRDAGYTAGSLRVMVAKALGRITLLEATRHYHRDEPYWPAFA